MTVEAKELIGGLFDRELGKIKTDWQINYVVYPFLPNEAMSTYM